IDPKMIEEFDKEIDYYKQHCSDENSTFKDTESFVKWANEEKRQYEIRWFIYKTKNDPTKVIYVDSNQSKSDSNSNLK
ncbi:ankyrin repeat domain-containing protein, partial [Campylobacter sp. Marseille-Q3452]|nr:ankyrin repeat domain-containing protein [Campylobacter massiliensis]